MIRDHEPPHRCLNRRLRWNEGAASDAESLVDLEWLVTNSVGGYASGTVAGVSTRRYHGLLVAAMPVHGRTVMLNHLHEELRSCDGHCYHLGGKEDQSGLDIHVAHLVEFRLEMGLPVWRYEVGGHSLEKRVLMPHGQNTVHVSYRLLDGDGPIELKLFLAMAFRPHDAPLEEQLARDYKLITCGRNRYTIETPDYPALRLALLGDDGGFDVRWNTDTRFHYRVEAVRGYDPVSAVLRPGHFSALLSRNSPVVTLTASTEAWDAIDALSPDESFAAEFERRCRLLEQAPAAAHDDVAAELVLAADQFIVTPGWRVHDLARGRAAGVSLRSIIAGYHWFTDWGRDTMISLEGLTLCTGRQHEARDILLTFAEHVKDGLIPNMFPEGKEEGLYHTADATLWFFHAVDRYVEITGDQSLLRHLLPKLLDIVQAHIAGTRYGIGVDPADGLLKQGAPGYQLTWMDAKVGDWVVTPRRGKAVEINALWYNALRLLEGWQRQERHQENADSLKALADRVYTSFNARFWYEPGQHLYDVLDGEDGHDDPACRPNQVFAISLRHPVLDPHRWHAVMEQVQQRLLTPVGLRSLAPGHPDYKSRYFGDLHARDAAYHQGTVWGWLIGPYVDAWLKLHGDDRPRARELLQGLVNHLGDTGIGTLSEVFDAEPPFTPRACIAQAWSVAEVLRCWLKTAPEK